MVKIVQKDNEVLRQKAMSIPVGEITSAKVKNIIKNMIKALDSQPDGIAIAAPQIGEPYRIFIVSRRIGYLNEDGTEKSEEERQNGEKFKDEVFINPEIIKISHEKKFMEEGCLSVRYIYGKVKRSVKATVRAYDQDGKRIVKPGSGLLAQIFQHETDHLEGILFSDKAVDIKEIAPETAGTNNPL